MNFLNRLASRLGWNPSRFRRKNDPDSASGASMAYGIFVCVLFLIAVGFYIGNKSAGSAVSETESIAASAPAVDGESSSESGSVQEDGSLSSFSGGVSGESSGLSSEASLETPQSQTTGASP